MEKVFFVFGRPTNRDLQAKKLGTIVAQSLQISFPSWMCSICSAASSPHTAQATERDSGNAPAVLAW